MIVADDHAAWTLGIDGDPRRATPNLDALARQGTLFQQSVLQLTAVHAQPAIADHGEASPRDRRDATGDASLRPGAHPGRMAARPRLRDRCDRQDAFQWAVGPWIRSCGLIRRTGNAACAEHPPRGGDNRRPWRPMLDPAREWLNADARSVGLPPDSMQSTFFVDRAIEFLKEKRNRPFAMVVSFYEPHSPFHFPDGWARRFRAGQFAAFPVSEADRRQQPEIFASLARRRREGNPGGLLHVAFLRGFADRQADRGPRSDGAWRRIRWSFTSETTATCWASTAAFEKHCFFEPGGSNPDDHALAGPHRKRAPGH